MTEPNSSQPRRMVREAHLRWVPIPEMRVSPLAQRELRQPWVDDLVANFDPEEIGNPTVNERDGHYYVIDGQHRIEALKQVGWGDQHVQCWTYRGLSEQEEAERFLKLNNKLTIDAFYKFRIGMTAGREEECEINRVVRSQQLVVSRDRLPGAISAVGTLRRIYRRDGSKVLARTLRIVRDAYGDAGLEAATIDGIGLLCARYNGELDEPLAIKRLSDAHGGVNGLLNAANKLRAQMGQQRGHCVAAAAVEIINRGRGGNKLKPWWSE